ncbi:hypothetical protein KAR10_02245, partial [bacterium]|nr:hypothetical protein [bacterium]
MSTPRPRPIERLVVTVIIAVTLGIVGALTLKRLDIESAVRRVEIAFPEARLLEAAAWDSHAAAALLEAGVTTLVRAPYTLDHMIRYGLAEAWHPEPDRLEIRLADEQLAGKATVYLTGQFGMSALKIRLRESQYIFDLDLPSPVLDLDARRYIMEIPSGPMPPGFRRALWLPAGDWGQTSDLDQFIQDIYSLQPEIVIPDWMGGGGAADFYRSYLHTSWLRKPYVAVPEFSLPRAGRKILRTSKSCRLFRAHLISSRIAAKLTEQRLLRRLVRAAQERSIGLLYIDPPKFWDFNQSLDFIRELKSALLGRGFELGAVERKRGIHTGNPAMNLIYLCVGALFFLFAWRAALWAVGFTGREEAVDIVLTIKLKLVHFRVAALVLVLGIFIIHWEGSAAWGGKIAALIIAVMVPLLSISQVYENYKSQSGFLSNWLYAGRDFLFISGCSLAAGLSIAVLLYHPEFVQRLDGFAGVKAAYLVPVFLAVLYLFPRITDALWWQERWKKGRRLWTITALVLIIGLVIILAARSGNAAWFPVSKLELDFREALERIFGVRPRVKEFLVGHPFLLLGLFGLRMSNNRDRIWPRLFLILGILGQI